MSVLSTITIYRMILVLIVSIPLAAHAENILYGKDIKNQASKFFKELGITGEILTSDRRAFFSCKKEIIFIKAEDEANIKSKKIKTLKEVCFEGSTFKLVSFIPD